MNDTVINITVMTLIWFITILLFKYIDWQTDYLVNRFYDKNLKLNNEKKGKFKVVSIFGNRHTHITSEVFDDLVIQWGVSRDFLLFKRAVGTINEKEKELLAKWETMQKGKTIKNSEGLYTYENFDYDNF